MPDNREDLRTGPRPRTVRTEDGRVLEVPEGWELLPPGDAALTRAVKAAGATWSISETKGRRTFSRGVWAPADHIATARASLETRRADPAHQRKLDKARRRREAQHAVYVREFETDVLDFLDFHPAHAALAAELAQRVTAVATPVGSGTVGRTERIPVPKRAEAAVLAWMRHQTTAYDDTSVARVKGARRDLRRKLAARSRAVLRNYRQPGPPPPGCPLAGALARPATPAASDVPRPRIPRVAARPPQRPARPSQRAGTAHEPLLRPAHAPAASPPPTPDSQRTEPPHAAYAASPDDTSSTSDTGIPGPAPRDAHEEAQRALYLKVLARRRRR